MKFLASILLACSLFIPNLNAKEIHEAYASVFEEIENYYHSSGQWELLKVSEIELVPADSIDYVLISAKTTIRNTHTGIGASEICLLSFTERNYDLYSINCF